jgi:microcompartment protein CcmL/EutN
VKAAEVTLFRIHVAMAIGGKGFLMLTGSVADVEAAVEAGARRIAERGLLVSKVVIPRPEERLYGEVI